MHRRATQQFHRGLLLSTPKEKKKNLKDEKNNLHGKDPNKQKKNEKSFWVFFNSTTTQAWKVN